jgi:hypothetical protein
VFDQFDPDGPICLNALAAPMTADDLKRSAERHIELTRPGEWQHLTGAQKVVSLLRVGKALQAALLERFLVRRSPVRVLVDQDVDEHQAFS